MWWSRPLATLALIAGLSACGFEPVYGPGGAGDDLAGQVALAPTGTQTGFVLRARLEDRLGPAGISAPYLLTFRTEVNQLSLGSTSAGEITRFRLEGATTYTLTDRATGDTVAEGRTRAFTGYSATGSTVATLAAERDAQRRLAVILADQVVEALILADLDAPAAIADAADAE